MNRENDHLHSLGRKTEYKSDYAPEVLETFENRHQDHDYWVKFNCPEFTSLCPITGQPDFAEIVISYIPDVRMVESKSLKLYLFSFRNHGDFHEDCVNIIMNDLIRLMDPKYIEVTGLFTPRGGISIHPYANYGRPGTKYERLARTRFRITPWKNWSNSCILTESAIFISMKCINTKSGAPLSKTCTTTILICI